MTTNGRQPVAIKISPLETLWPQNLMPATEIEFITTTAEETLSPWCESIEAMEHRKSNFDAFYHSGGRSRENFAINCNWLEAHNRNERQRLEGKLFIGDVTLWRRCCDINFRSFGLLSSIYIVPLYGTAFQNWLRRKRFSYFILTQLNG